MKELLDTEGQLFDGYCYALARVLDHQRLMVVDGLVYDIVLHRHVAMPYLAYFGLHLIEGGFNFAIQLFVELLGELVEFEE